MKVVGGAHKGRRIFTPKGIKVRPTAERTREAIFNILTHGLIDWSGNLTGANVLDVFCGTGALGIEALSRGAGHVTFLEQSEVILTLTKRNAAIGIDSTRSTTFLKLDATNLPQPPRAIKSPCQIAFLDPPYGKNLAVPALINLKAKRWLTQGALAVLETNIDESFLEPPGYKILEKRTYGITQIIFLQINE